MKVPVQLFERYEWVEEGKGYREALVPAEELNVLYIPTLFLWLALNGFSNAWAKTLRRCAL
jgi:hypothetical protein